MSWSHYLQLIRQEKTDLDEWYAIVKRNEKEGDPIGQIGAAMYDALDEARHKGQVFRGIATILLSFIKQAAALRQQVEDLERDAREAADLLAAAHERVAELENTVDEAQLQADEYCDERDRARTEVLFLQDRVSPQTSFEGLQELFDQRMEIGLAIDQTVEAVFAPGVYVWWDHNGHEQCGQVTKVYAGHVWVRNLHTNVTRRLDPHQIVEVQQKPVSRVEETADVA